MSLLPVGISGEEAGYQIERSLRFNSADSAYLNRTVNAVATSNTLTTFSFWFKRAKLGTSQQLFASATSAPNVACYIELTTSDTLKIYLDMTAGGSDETTWTTSAVFRDVSAWYGATIKVDTSQASNANKVVLYINGVSQTLTASQTGTAVSTQRILENGISLTIGKYFNSSGYGDFYLAEFYAIDGQALTPSSFGETNPTTGVWQPKKYTGTYGTNGFYLNFSDNASTTTLGDDLSGNGNDWTTNNFSVTAGAGNDSFEDTPTNNWATLNPLSTTATELVLSNGNITATANAGGTNWGSSVSTIGVSSGKWVWEVYCTTASGNADYILGITSSAMLPLSGNSYPGINATSYGYLNSTGGRFNNASSTNIGFATYTAGDVIRFELDMDAGSCVVFKNNTSQGTFISGLSGTWFPAVACYDSTSDVVNVGFGQAALNASATYDSASGGYFVNTPTSGFKALCTQNLPEPTIKDGGDYFNTILYTGTGSSNARTGVGFQPDLVWIKERNASADHALYDAVRGVQQQLESNTTTDETTESTGLTAFGSDGFTVGSLAQVNTNNDTYVAWCWKESTTSKFDIVTYTGNGTARTISHNLGVVPNMIIVKARTTASTDQGWPVYHSANTANPETDYLLLNTTAATADLDTVWNDTAPTSSVFSVGTNALVNANNDTYVAYLFANVAGYSAFGSYTGNGSTDGPFVYTGFRPAFVMVKASSTTGDWVNLDDVRDPSNAVANFLRPNLSDAEGNAGGLVDFCSNGFKQRNTFSNYNTNAVTYIYAAFAENPFKYSLAR